MPHDVINIELPAHEQSFNKGARSAPVPSLEPVARLVATAPRLTNEQREQLGAILGGAQ